MTPQRRHNSSSEVMTAFIEKGAHILWTESARGSPPINMRRYSIKISLRITIKFDKLTETFFSKLSYEGQLHILTSKSTTCNGFLKDGIKSVGLRRVDGVVELHIKTRTVMLCSLFHLFMAKTHIGYGFAVL